MSAPFNLASYQIDVVATLRRWGVAIDDPDAEFWPEIGRFIARADDELFVLEPDRRERVAHLVAKGPNMAPREQAFVLGALWEILAVVQHEAPGVNQ